jgi:formylglycine-generating enzyme
MTRMVLAWVGLAAIVVGCQPSSGEPRAQWVVEISTDAPVPQLGDRLLVEILRDDGLPCTGCVREFGVDSPSSLPISFGVLPQAGTTLHVRATLFRAEASNNLSRPLDDAHVEALGQLPPAHGIVKVALPLHMECFGIASNPSTHESCDPSSKSLGQEPLLVDGPPLVTGAWARAVSRPCTNTPPDGMACIDGGPLLLGSYSTPAIDVDLRPAPQHLVVLSPFFVDKDEVTVGTVRQLLLTNAIPPQDAPTLHASSISVDDWDCRYLGLDDASNDAWSVTCLTFAAARDVCNALGKRLVKEAEWEYVARNGKAQTTFPWGEGGDICARSIVARGFSNTTSSGGYQSSACRNYLPNQILEGGPVAGGNPNDVTTSGVRNMAGNVSEWVADTFAPYKDVCWSSPVLNDPQCNVEPLYFHHLQAVRGGNWRLEAFNANSAIRNLEPLDTRVTAVGVRCAKDL